MRTCVQRSSALVLVAALITGCAPVTTFNKLAAADKDLFARCREPVGAYVCRNATDASNWAACLDSKAAQFARMPTVKSRRRWLAANQCPASIMDAPTTVTDGDGAPMVEGAPSLPSQAPGTPPAVDPPATEPLASESPVTEPPVATDESPKTIEPPDASEAAADATGAGPPVDDDPPMPVVDRPVRPFAERARPSAREQRLREIIVSHGAEMKTCVDRQLKLVPNLWAEGKLVIHVDASGSVPGAGLEGDRLAGTPLETCLRTLASRWRFPPTGRAYVVEAPVKIGAPAPAR